ncbi:hypothetical protein [Rhizobium sp. LjRoot258]|uniref:hypothetical protein n=1 Tax=Rhizobium sp. LjRoot258 TaxID=3342299 RepID=UPI003ECDEDEB
MNSLDLPNPAIGGHWTMLRFVRHPKSIMEEGDRSMTFPINRFAEQVAAYRDLRVVHMPEVSRMATAAEIFAPLGRVEDPLRAFESTKISERISETRKPMHMRAARSSIDA